MYPNKLQDQARIALIEMINERFPTDAFIKAIGTDTTLERGEVIVYAVRHNYGSSLDYAVAPIGAKFGLNGLPAGLRDAPMGTRFAAKAAMSGEGFDERYCSPDFKFIG